MKVSKDEILHIAKLAHLNIEENELEKYIENLEDILNFAEVVNNAPVDNLDMMKVLNENQNVFRKDEVEVFEDLEGLLQNAPSKEQDMFEIPKVIS